MPIERRPANPLPRGPRPGSLNPPHQVRDHETWETVAQRYGVQATALIHHNCGTTNPAEVNWYLHEYVGCKLPTRDGKNWCFSSQARPGLIYIPQRPLMRMDPELFIGPVAVVDLTQPVNQDKDFPLSTKFAFELAKWPPVEPLQTEYLMLQVSGAVEGELKPKDPSVKVTVKGSQIKAAIEKDLGHNITLSAAAKVDFDKLLGAAKKGKQEFCTELAKSFEASLKRSFKWQYVTLTPEVGLETSLMPVLVRVTGQILEFPLEMDGRACTAKVALKLNFNIGPSKKQWARLAEKLGRPVLDKLSRGLAALLESVGVQIALGVVAVAVITFDFFALNVWLINYANYRGDLTTLFHWYLSAYTAKVFGEPRPSGPIQYNLLQVKDELVVAAEKDAVQDARASLSRSGDAAGAQGPDAQVLLAFKSLLLEQSHGNEYDAKLRLRQGVESRAQRLLGK